MSHRAHRLKFLTLLAAAILAVFAPLVTIAQEQETQLSTHAPQLVVPQTIRFSGVAANRTGDTVEAVFRIYLAAQGGEALWSEVQPVRVGSDGKFTVLLGAATKGGLPESLFQAGEARWIGISIEQGAEGTRAMLTSVAYAMKAADAESLAGRPAKEFVTQDQLAAELVTASATPPVLTGLHPDATPTGGGVTSVIPMWTSPSNLGNSALTQLGTSTAPLLGIGTVSPATTLDVAGGTTLRGSVAMPAPSVATATLGVNSPLFSMSASSFKAGASASNQTFTWRAVATGNNTATPAANLTLLYASGGIGMVNTGLSIAPTGRISFAPGQTFPGTGAGTITKVIATSPLTGGGSLGAITLGLDTTALQTALNVSYAQLGSANNFAKLQTMTQGLTVFGTSTADLVNSNDAYDMNGAVWDFGDYGEKNSYMGFSASPSAYSGSENVAAGYLSMAGLVDGWENTALGVDTLNAETGGFQNTAVGAYALLNTVGGCPPGAASQLDLNSDTEGMPVRRMAGSATKVHSNITCASPLGYGDTAVGALADQFNVGGLWNTALGYAAGSAPSAPQLFRATALGAGSTVTQSRSVILGYTTTIPGQGYDYVGIGTPSPISALDISLDAEGKLGPSITLTNPSAAGGGSSSIDFNTTPPKTGASIAYNPGARIVAEDTNYSDNISFYANKPGAKDNGLKRTMTIYSNGDVNVVGNLSKGGGSFKIDHPLDPANKYLYHSFVESPDMMNVYSGTVTLDAHGKAIVQMPEWFEALNNDFRYQLTAVGAPGPFLFIAEEIKENHFRIGGGKAGMKVSWMVMGVRQDAWANAHRIPVEEDKPANERGYYLHPELYGAGDERQVSNAPKDQ